MTPEESLRFNEEMQAKDRERRREDLELPPVDREQILVDAIVQARRDLWWFIERFAIDNIEEEAARRAMRIQDDVLGKALDEYGRAG